jgi:hypothetical protein
MLNNVLSLQCDEFNMQEAGKFDRAHPQEFSTFQRMLNVTVCDADY